MSTVTINAIRNAVNQVLGRHFPDVEIMDEEIKQGLIEPCFFVKLIQVGQIQELGLRYNRTHAFDIHYFGENNPQAHDVAEKLYNVMDEIEHDGDLFRGSGMRHEIIDGVLHFFVNYNFKVRKVIPESPKMHIIEQKGGVKYE